MQCHTGFVWADPLIPAAVLIASLTGSGHCALMCGGLVSAAARSKTDQVFYHLARLAGYMALGAVSGWFGGRAAVRFPEEVSVAAAWVIAASFVWIGVSGWRRGTQHFALPGSAVLNRWIARLIQSNAAEAGSATPASAARAGRTARARHAIYAGAVGFFSIFLPCGWLYGFVLAALSTADPARGALLMFLFWAGTLPALAVSRWFLAAAARIAGTAAPKLSSVFLMAAGILPILARYLPAKW